MKKQDPAQLVDIPYGFRWGDASAVRYVSHRGYLILGIETPRQHVQIHVTPTGMIRVGKPVKAKRKRK